jgi:hypothetical protein
MLRKEMMVSGSSIVSPEALSGGHSLFFRRRLLRFIVVNLAVMILSVEKILAAMYRTTTVKMVM